MLKKNSVVALIIACSAAFAAPAGAQEVEPTLPSIEQRVLAKEAYKNADFEPYGKYLLDTLAWYEYQYRHGNPSFDVTKVRNTIIRTAKGKKKGPTDRLTQADLEEKMDDARLLIEDDDRGKLGEYRRKIHDLCISLSRYYSIISEPEQSLKYRERAARFD